MHDFKIVFSIDTYTYKTTVLNLKVCALIIMLLISFIKYLVQVEYYFIISALYYSIISHK